LTAYVRELTIAAMTVMTEDIFH